MGKIRQLPEDVAMKIAAGEVVERPASVIKELVENALDAGATQIEVLLEDGGKTAIEVSDNGCGMDREDAVRAFARHGTSKIQSVDDLHSLTTLGFRGEALAAIGASAEVTLHTAEEAAREGTAITMSQGVLAHPKPHAPVPGTRIRVRNLFHSIPARQKFLKSDATEWKACLDVITKQMVTHPEVGFVAKHNGRVIHEVPANQSFMSRVSLLWGIVASALIPVESEVPHLSLSGVIAQPEIAHSASKGRQFFAVNGHPITDKAIARSIKDAFGTLLPPTITPVYALSLTIHPGMVDVNIHPRKDEVRFINPGEVFRFVLQSVSQALGSQTQSFSRAEHIASPLLTTNAAPVYPKQSYDTVPAPSSRHFERRTATFSPTLALPPIAAETEEQVTTAPTPILTFDACYLLTVRDGSLLLIDQHAAHERILYHRLWQEHEKQTPTSQPLLLPVVLHLDETERALLEDHQASLESLGFGFSQQDGQSVLTQVSSLLASKQPEQLLRQALAGVGEERHDPDLRDVTHRLYAMLACKAAVKAGDSLSELEKQKLVADLLSLPDRFTCPHGRPSYITLEPTELEKLFKRTGFGA